MQIRAPRGVTLVELLVAMAIASILILGVIAAFQTSQRTAAIGDAREQIYQNGRVALDLMASEIKNAYIDNRNRDLVFISADGLAGRGNSILEYDTITHLPDPNSGYGLGNAQTPFGVYCTADPLGSFGRWQYDELMSLYADETFGYPLYSVLSIKAINDIYTLSPGPPDRLDFVSLTAQHNETGISENQARMRFVRYMIMTETFVDDVDNDYDGSTDAADSDPPNDANGLLGVGDLIPVEHRDDYNPVTKKILALSLFQLHRAMDIYKRTPARTMADWDPQYATADRTDENIGSYVYDLQFEFYGKIAIALKSDGSPEVWGIGWGYQDVRGEDTGTDCDGDAVLAAGDKGAFAIQSGRVGVTKNSDRVTPSTTTPPSWPADLTKLKGGTFFIWPSGTDTFDTADPANDVYTIADVDTGSGQLILGRPYTGAGETELEYRIVEPTQANGILDQVNGAYPEDVGSDGLVGDQLDDSSGVPNNVSDNDGTTTETSFGEGNHRLDSRVMGIWDSRSPDPRNPRRASELDGQDSDSGGVENDFDGLPGDTASDAEGVPEADNPATVGVDESNNLIDDDADGVVDDRFYEAAGKPEGIDEPDEADPYDDSLPKAVRITIAVRDAQQSLQPVVLSTIVWLSTAK